MTENSAARHVDADPEIGSEDFEADLIVRLATGGYLTSDDWIEDYDLRGHRWTATLTEIDDGRDRPAPEIATCQFLHLEDARSSDALMDFCDEESGDLLHLFTAVADSDGRIAGRFYKPAIEHSGDVVFIENVTVTPAYRGHDYGMRLLEYALTKALPHSEALVVAHRVDMTTAADSGIVPDRGLANWMVPLPEDDITVALHVLPSLKSRTPKLEAWKAKITRYARSSRPRA